MIDDPSGLWLGRVWLPEAAGPAVITLRDGELVDVTVRDAATVADICEMDDPAGWLRAAPGRVLGRLDDVAEAPVGDPSRIHLLAPCDLQVIKACGVTFAQSMVERVIEEKAAGDPARAEAIRDRIAAIIGESLRDIRAGSPEAAAVKQALMGEGMWSQYLEVGIGPDAEVFTKSQPMSAVGHGALVGVNKISNWNNPEPEIVLAVNARGEIRGATLGNDVNLRDVEGRSALLLGKAKDNNASCAIGPFIRLFDEGFSIADIEKAELSMSVRGKDGFELSGRSNMAEISRAPAELVRQTLSSHQYPDGFMLFLGTMFAPTQDRGTPGSGFTHHEGDVVEIATPLLGTLSNTVTSCEKAAPWTFGARALMRNLVKRGVLA